MRLSVLPNTDVPAYRQIFDQLAAQILSGELLAGSALPPIRTVSRALGVSVITVRSAWDALEREGLIETRAGSGCYVAALPERERERRRMDALKEPLSAAVRISRQLGYAEAEVIALLERAWKEEL